jgi:hypothetical protein
MPSLLSLSISWSRRITSFDSIHFAVCAGFYSVLQRGGVNRLRVGNWSTDDGISIANSRHSVGRLVPGTPIGYDPFIAVCRSQSPVNKISLLRRYGLPVIACGIALIVARPLRAEASSFVLAIIV